MNTSRSFVSFGAHVDEQMALPAVALAPRKFDPRVLLGRPEIETDLGQVASYLTGRRVLVTGAGGSIGSELSRQVKSFEPERLVMLDRDESALHALQLSIEGHGQLDDRKFVLADIRDVSAVRSAFVDHRPEVIFHAAALKHVPLLELYPTEGYKTNVIGTANLLRLAEEFGTQTFVNVSTDKAADPANVLGYTKRIAERLTAKIAARDDAPFLSVRFGNVLGSRGSVLETWLAQLALGLPLTVVHPEVTRYFMTVQEAVQLVLQAGAIGSGGDALVLDMGEPVRIADVAQQLLDCLEAPNMIRYTGLRPGEKMHEVLFAGNEIGVGSSHPLITRVAVPGIDWETRDLGELSDDEAVLVMRGCCMSSDTTDSLLASTAPTPTAYEKSRAGSPNIDLSVG